MQRKTALKNSRSLTIIWTLWHGILTRCKWAIPAAPCELLVALTFAQRQTLKVEIFFHDSKFLAFLWGQTCTEYNTDSHVASISLGSYSLHKFYAAITHKNFDSALCCSCRTTRCRKLWSCEHTHAIHGYSALARPCLYALHNLRKRISG